jgi:hydrogenase nickel incorporation protein HypA/HybF
MHELSIASAILEIAEEQAAGRRVVSVQVRVGHLRQVVPSALAFNWDLVTPGTAAAGSRLDLEAVPAEGLCRRCGTRSLLRGFPLACERCGDLHLEIVAGEELSVESLELLEEDDDAGA